MPKDKRESKEHCLKERQGPQCWTWKKADMGLSAKKKDEEAKPERLPSGDEGTRRAGRIHTSPKSTLSCRRRHIVKR